jgi:hypothetical protein
MASLFRESCCSVRERAAVPSQQTCPAHLRAVCAPQRDTPLHVACAMGNKKACRLLIAHGGDPMSTNWAHQRPHQVCDTLEIFVSSSCVPLRVLSRCQCDRLQSREVSELPLQSWPPDRSFVPVCPRAQACKSEDEALAMQAFLNDEAEKHKVTGWIACTQRDPPFRLHCVSWLSSERLRAACALICLAS